MIPEPALPASRAILLIGNDVEADMLDAYERWHRHEHVPERLGMPGFLAARRYARGKGKNRRFLTIYELESVAALGTAAYLDLLANPSVTSARMRNHLRHVERAAFELTGGPGEPAGGRLARLPLPDPSTAVPLIEAARMGRSSGLSLRVGTPVPISPHPALATHPAGVATKREAFLEAACGDEATRLPSGLVPEPCWHALISAHGEAAS